MDGAWLAAVGPFAAAALMLGLAAVLLWLDPGSRPVRAFVAFLVLRAGIHIATTVSGLLPAIDELALGNSVVYYDIGIASAMVAFLSTYPRRRAVLGHKWVLLALLGATFASAVSYAVEPCVIICDDGGGYGPLAPLLVAVPVAAACAAALLFREAARAPVSMQRASMGLLATGFMAEASLRVGLQAGLLLTVGPPEVPVLRGLGLIMLIAWLVAIGALLSVARIVQQLAIGNSITAAVSLFVGASAIILPSLTTSLLLGLVRLALPVLATYALARHRLFDLDIKVRLAARRATIGAIFAGVFFVVTEGSAYALGTQFGMVAGIMAVGALVPLMGPLRRAAERIVEFLPGDDAAPRDLPLERRRQIYHEFALQAWSDGSMAREERAFLDQLRERLALNAEDALKLESQAAKGTSR